MSQSEKHDDDKLNAYYAVFYRLSLKHNITG